MLHHFLYSLLEIIQVSQFIFHASSSLTSLADQQTSGLNEDSGGILIQSTSLLLDCANWTLSYSHSSFHLKIIIILCFP